MIHNYPTKMITQMCRKINTFFVKINQNLIFVNLTKTCKIKAFAIFRQN